MEKSVIDSLLQAFDDTVSDALQRCTNAEEQRVIMTMVAKG